MSKRLQVVLEDEMMRKLKLHAFDNDTTIKDIVVNLLEGFFGSAPTSTVKPLKPIIEPVKPPVETRKTEPVYTNGLPGQSWTPTKYKTFDEIMNEEPDESETHYILRKTAKTKLIHGSAQYQYDNLLWVVMDGQKAHFDKNGDPIPFRFTDWDGKVQEPDIHDIEEQLGKPVKIEK